MHRSKALLFLITLFCSVNLWAFLPRPTFTKPNATLFSNAPVSLFFAWATSHNCQFELDTSPNFNSSLLLRKITNTKIEVSNLRFNTKYYFRVRAYTGIDSSTWTSTRILTTLSSPVINDPKDKDTAMYMVAKLSTYRPGAFIRMQMDTSAQFNSPRLFSEVYADTAPILTYPVLMQMGENKKLLFNTKYFIRMKYFHGTDSSGWGTATVKTLRSMNIYSPANNAVTEVNPNIFISKYMAAGSTARYSDSLFYHYQLDTSLKFNSSLAKNYYTQDHGLTGKTWLTFNKTYYLRARGFNEEDTSDWSKVVTFKTKSFATITTPKLQDSIIRPDSVAFMSNTPAYGFELQMDVSKNFNSPALVIQYSTANVPISVKGLLWNRKYYTRIRAINPGGDTSGWGYRNFYTTFTHKLLEPTNNYKYTLTSEELKWEKLYGVTYYEYELDTVPGFNSNVLRKVSVKGHLNTDTAKEMYFYQQYYWRVRAHFPNSISSWTSTFTFKTSDMAIYISSPLWNQKNVDVNPTEIDWNDINYSSIKGYHYQLSKDSLFANPINGYTKGTESYADHFGLENSTRYFIRVRGFHARDTNDWYYEIPFYTEAPDPVPAAPVKIAPADGSTRQNYQTLTLSWQATANASSFDVETDIVSTFTNPVKGNFNANNINLTNLTPYTQYFWRVRAVNSSVKGPWSTVWTFTTLPPVLPPTSLTPDNFQEKPRAFFLGWNSVFGADYYQFQLSNNFSFGNQAFLANTNAAPLSGLTDGLTYYWRVRSVFGPYASSWSDVATFRVKGSITDVEDARVADKLSVFPNPGSGRFFISGVSAETISSFDVYDLMGKMVMKAVVNTDAQSTPFIELSDLPAGMYVLNAVVDGKLISLKVSIN